MTQTIDGTTGEIMILDRAEEEFRILDRFGPPSRVATPRVDWLATISAGAKAKNERGAEYPTVSRDGTIRLHDPEGRATELATILEAEGWKRITIALASDRLTDVIQQRYVLYSASAVLAYGDDLSIKQLVKDGWVEHHVGSEEYEVIRALCQVSWSLFFVVARWIGQQTQIVFPDGLGQYRLRSASRHSLANVVGKLQEIKGVTGGPLSGIPLDLSITYRDVAGADGKRRNIPVWTLALKPPEAIQLTSGNFRALLGGAHREAETLRLLPAPRAATMDDEVRDEVIILGEATAVAEDAVAAALTTEVRCDPEPYRAGFFAAVRDTEYDSDEARAKLVREYTSDPERELPPTESLAEFLATASEREASGFVAWVSEKAVASMRAERDARIAELVPKGAAAFEHMSLDDGYADGTPRASGAQVVVPPATEASAADSSTSAEEAPAEPFVQCTPEQKAALLALANRRSMSPAARKPILECDWEHLSTDEAATWIESLQS